MTKEHGQSSGTFCVDEDNREIVIAGPIDYEIAGNFLAALGSLRSKRPVSVILLSPGGDEGAGWAMHDAMRLNGSDVYIQCFGECYSIAPLIMQGATLRMMSPNCRFMVHNGHASFGGVETSKLNGLAREADGNNKRYYEALAERSVLTVAEVKRLCDDETYLGAQDCLNFGLIDGIISRIGVGPAPHKATKTKKITKAKR